MNYITRDGKVIEYFHMDYVVITINTGKEII
jgi:hypothetical protein